MDPSHRVAKGMGGTRDERSNTAANNLHACRPCHDAVESQPARAYANGWKIRHGVQDPTQVPARHVRFGWVLLALDGSWTPVELAECGAHPSSAACPDCTACKRCGPCGCELVAGWQQRTPA
ncbi:hypothetical protein [Microbispora sp. KK1-11]|uniref:hypothetical protein n=1 Tax=Microbispora sp. KK1-11 TaxID=2053005 RepID=UPI00115B2030|nr:hypothetical protein [Microbispora sp. KK1-11]TQS30010.1 hypothetical protein FLW16_06515 [Microbispora sp. KK1-11]